MACMQLTANKRQQIVRHHQGREHVHPWVAAQLLHGRRTSRVACRASWGFANCHCLWPAAECIRRLEKQPRVNLGVQVVRTMAPPSLGKLAERAQAGVTHVLFDMDGLLLDTEKFYTVVQQRILAAYGKTFTWDLKAKMMGKKALEAGRILVEEMDLVGVLSPEDFIKEREQALHTMFPSSQLMPGAEQLIRHLHTHGVPMAIATSSHRSHYELKTSQHKELVALMHHVVVGDDPDVALGKPAPDIFLTAAKRFQDPSLQLHNVLVFEDAPSGVAAAQSAGMKVVMVPDPNLDRSLCIGADQVLSSLLEFKPSDWGLPPFV